MSVDPTQEVDEQPFPPDERLSLPWPLTFSRLLAAVVVVAAVVDLVRVGPGATPFPYDYPFYAALVFVLGLLFALPRIHGIMDGAKIAVADLVARTATNGPTPARDSDLTPGQIQSEFERTLSWAFDPRLLLLGALVDGTFTVGTITFFDVWSVYAYPLTTFAYGSLHGLFYFPIFGTMVLAWKLPRRLLVDVDVLDPDGMGGYRGLADAVVWLIVLVVAFLAIDFVVISAVSAADPFLFRILAWLLYAGMVLFYAGFSAVGIVLLRRRLFDLRDRKAAHLRWEFREVERRLREDGEPVAERVQALDALVSRLPGLEFWPFHRLALFRFVVVAAASLALVALHVGLVLQP